VASRINGYKGMRTQLVKRGLQATVVEFFNGVARKVIPPGSALAVELQDMAASYWNARTDLGILTWVWNSYSCGRHVVAESFIQFREGDFGLFLSCTTEVRWVEIGGTSAPVEVKICQYQSQ